MNEENSVFDTFNKIYYFFAMYVNKSEYIILNLFKCFKFDLQEKTSSMLSFLKYLMYKIRSANA